MGNLQTKLIRDAYPGLIKTDDEMAITATPKPLQDGVGNDLPVSVGTTSMIYTGTQDFTGATVVGVGGGGSYETLPGWIVPGRKLTSGWSFPANWGLPFPGRQSQTLTNLTISVHTAFTAGVTMDVYLYNTQHRDTPGADSMVIPFEKLHTLATGVALDVSGDISISVSPFTLPATGVYYIYIVQNDTAGGLWLEAANEPSSGNTWANWLQAYNPFNSNTAYAARHSFSGAAAGAPATLPSNGTGIGSLVRPAFFYFKYN